MPLAEFIAENREQGSSPCFIEKLPSGKVAAVFVQEGTEFAASVLPQQTVGDSYLSPEDQRALNRELLVQGIIDSRDTWADEDTPEEVAKEKPVEFAYVTAKSEVITFALPYNDLFDQIHSLDGSKGLFSNRGKRRERMENAEPDEISDLLEKVDLGPSFAERCARISPVTAETERGRLQVFGKPNAEGESTTVGKADANPDNETMLLCDFHNHSTWSDGKKTAKEMVDMYGERGFDVVCMTDHLVNPKSLAGKVVASSGLVLTPEKLPAYLAELEELKTYAKEKYGMILLAGVEVNKDSLIPNKATHLLCIDIKAPTDPSLSLEKIADQVHQQGGVTVVAHPDYFYNLREGAPRNWEFHTRNQFKQIERARFFHDGWEVANGNFVFPKVAEKVEEMGLSGLGNSDCHAKPHHMNTWRTVMFAEKEPEEIKLKLRSGEMFVNHDDHPDVLYQPKDLIGLKGGRYTFEQIDAKKAANESEFAENPEGVKKATVEKVGKGTEAPKPSISMPEASEEECSVKL